VADEPTCNMPGYGRADAHTHTVAHSHIDAMPATGVHSYRYGHAATTPLVILVVATATTRSPSMNCSLW